MMVWHVVWDMASSQKKAVNIAEYINTHRIDLNSEAIDFERVTAFTVGYGGLHLAKSPINCLRNHVLTHNGENFGINILRSHKSHEILQGIKNAVFLGKDRQSDFLAYLTTSAKVQEFLKSLKWYRVVKVPEPILGYKENAKTQKNILLPTCVVANSNGDVFILDRASACLHVVDRSAVSKCFIIGNYQESSLHEYRSSDILLAQDVKLSNKLTTMCIDDDDRLFINDGRNEIVVMMKASPARAVLSSRLHLLKIDGCVSFCHVESKLILSKDEDGQYKISFLSFTVPAKSDYHLVLEHTITKTIKTTLGIKGLFNINDQCFGAWLVDDGICYFQRKKGKWFEVKEKLKSTILPSANSEKIITMSKEKTVIHRLDTSKPEIGSVIKFLDDSLGCSATIWGKVVFLLQKKAPHTYQLVEFGPLDFALKFCNAMDNFYSAISYIPPNTPGFSLVGGDGAGSPP